MLACEQVADDKCYAQLRNGINSGGPETQHHWSAFVR
jgi:hypothetical protein